MSSLPRLNRLFHPESGRCIDIAMDHGFFGEPDLLTGVEDMAAAVGAIVEGAPEAIQVAPGQAALLQDRPGRFKPALVIRGDVANVYSPVPPSEPFDLLLDDAIGQAVRLDAVCVCLNLFDITGQGDLRRQCMENIGAARTAGERAGMPIMVEPLPMRPGAGAYEVEADADRLIPLVRQATELGADLIKCDATEDLADFGRLVEAARVPVLVRGGGRIDEGELFERTQGVLERGARGIVYGRNVIQHPDPAAMVRALRSVVHEGASPAAAARSLVAAAT
jgi:fructose-bisphosphate aldolase, class I